MVAVSRQKVLGAFGVVGVGVLLSSPAYGCTVFRGEIKAHGNSVKQLTQDGAMHGALRDMDWCENTTNYNSLVEVAPTVAGTTGSSSITYKSGPTANNTADYGGLAGGCPMPGMRNGLTDRSYTVKVTNPLSTYMPPGGGPGPDHNCHSDKGTPIAVGNVINEVFSVHGTQPLGAATSGPNANGMITTTFSFGIVDSNGAATANSPTGKSSLCIFNTDGATPGVPQNGIDAMDILFDVSV